MKLCKATCVCGFTVLITPDDLAYTDAFVGAANQLYCLTSSSYSLSIIALKPLDYSITAIVSGSAS